MLILTWHKFGFQPENPNVSFNSPDWLRLQVVIKTVDELFLIKSWLPWCPLDVKVSRVAECMDARICSAGDVELDGNNGLQVLRCLLKANMRWIHE